MAAVVVALLALLISVAPAAATPVADKQAEAARVERRLAALGERISVLDEQYNQARLHQEEAEAALAENAVAAADAARQAEVARAQLGRMALSSYVHSGSASLIGALLRGSGQDLPRRRRYVRVALDEQQRGVHEMVAARQTLVAARGRLEDDRRDARAAAAGAASRRRQAETTIAQQQTTLRNVDGEVASLVVAERERREQESARAAQDALAARAAAPQAPSSTSTSTSVAAAAAAAVTTTTTTALTPLAGPLAVTTTTTSRTTTTVAKPATVTKAVSSGAAAAVEEARRQLGKPYVFGGSGPDSFDCSGLTAWAWRAGGRSLPHSATAQYNAIAHVATADRQPGDLVFFGSDLHHVGIYVGNDQMIEAPHTGAVVRYATIWRTDLVGVGRP